MKKMLLNREQRRWLNEREQEMRERHKLKIEAENWRSAQAFLQERGLVEEFCLWDLRRTGTSARIMSIVERAYEEERVAKIAGPEAEKVIHTDPC